MRSTVEYISGVAAFQAEVEKGVEQALHEGAQLLKAAIVARETRVGTTQSPVYPGHLRDSFEVGRVEHRGGKSSIDVYSRDPNAIWQNFGTLRSRRRALKFPRRERAHKGAGVTPLRFFENGLRDAWPAMLEMLARRMPGRA